MDIYSLGLVLLEIGLWKVVDRAVVSVDDADADVYEFGLDLDNLIFEPRSRAGLRCRGRRRRVLGGDGNNARQDEKYKRERDGNKSLYLHLIS